MTEPLILLTMDAYLAIAQQGKVEQVSQPLLIGLENGMPEDRVHDGIEKMATDYKDANAYVMGAPHEVERGSIISFVLYKLSE